jgi:hypothetical protein
MTHLTELQLSMHADDALSADESRAATTHLAACEICQAVFQVNLDEKGIIATALNQESAEAKPIPKFSRPASLKEFAIANVATGLVIWLVQFLWKTLFGELIVNAATWITSVYLPDIYELTTTTALYYLQEGTAMLDTYLGFIILSLSMLATIWLLLRYRKSHVTANLCMVVLLSAAVVLPSPASALEIKRDEGVITIPEEETVDDTLVLAADRVVVKGKVTGDLVVFGRKIDIDGVVEGNLLAFGESVTVRGSVGGLVLGAGSSFELSGAQVGGDFWAAGENVSVDARARIVNNAIVAGNSTTIDGFVSKDMYAFAETVELNGELGEDLEAFGNRVRLLDDAHIGGNARLRMNSQDQFHRADSARVDGTVEFLDLPDELQPTSRYASAKFYLWQLARLVSALLVGVALLWLIPRLRNVVVSSGVDGMKTAGIGLVALVSMPVIAVIVAISLIGIPFSIMALVAWILIIYLAKIVMGIFVGGLVLDNTKYRDSNTLVLLAGLSIIIVVVNLPAIGGVISFLLTIVGIGLIVQQVQTALSMRQTERNSNNDIQPMA